MHVLDKINKRMKMKTTVVITKLPAGDECRKFFVREAEAREYFYNFCEIHDLEYQFNSEEAGGIGFDYRIELVEDEQ